MFIALKSFTNITKFVNKYCGIVTSITQKIIYHTILVIYHII